MEIIPIGEHELLVFLVQFAVLLGLARLLGSLMQRIGQPSVIGQIAAGVLLGPTVFGALWPQGAAWLFPPEATSSAMLLAVGWIGILMLLALTGFSTDLGLVRRLGIAAAAVSVGSLLLPFAFGLGAGFVLPAEFLGDASQRTVFALFLATALSISSLPVIAKILSELRLTRRNFAQLTIASAMANDVAGWLLLGVVATLSRSGDFDVGKLLTAIAGMAVFFAVMFTVGQRAVDLALRIVRDRAPGVPGALSLTLVIVFGAAAVTHALGVEAVLGAFVAGIVIGRSRFRDTRVTDTLETVTAAVFAPFFFAAAGLRVDLALLADPVVIFWSAFVVLVASAGKFAGAYIGGRVARLARAEAFALGAGLNARGALEIVVATVGLSLGVLNTRSYTVVVVMAIATSMAAPPLLRAVTRRWHGSEEERRRLEEEETLGDNLLVRREPVLLPVQRPGESVLAGRIVDLAWPAGVPVTVLGVGDAGEAATRPVLGTVSRRPVEAVQRNGSDPAEAVLRQLRLGYGAVAVGAREGADGVEPLSVLTDRLLVSASLPVLLVRSGTNAPPDARAGFSRILVPIVGTLSNRLAQEVGFSAAATGGADLLLAHVAPPQAGAGPEMPVAGPGATSLLTRRPPAGDELTRQVVEEAAALAERLGARPRSVLRRGTSPLAEMLEVVRDFEPDLVVLSAELRPGHPDRPFLGPFVERMLEDTSTDVVVIGVPPSWRRST